jgi:hypothetical protein
MRIQPQSRLWLLALGVVLTGCSQPVDRPHKASVVTNLDVLPGASEVVLTVRGHDLTAFLSEKGARGTGISTVRRAGFGQGGCYRTAGPIHR